MDVGTYRKRYEGRHPKLLVQEVARLEKRYNSFLGQLAYDDPRVSDALNEWQGAQQALEAVTDPQRKR